MTYTTNQIMSWGSDKISDHNRSPLQIDEILIERRRRMIDGTMRRYLTARKRTFTVSWTDLPSHNDLAGSGTVDSGLSGSEMETFVGSADNPFTLTLRNGAGDTETYSVYISEFSKEVVKRGIVDRWNLNVVLEEV